MLYLTMEIKHDYDAAVHPPSHRQGHVLKEKSMCFTWIVIPTSPGGGFWFLLKGVMTFQHKHSNTCLVVHQIVPSCEFTS